MKVGEERIILLPLWSWPSHSFLFLLISSNSKTQQRRVTKLVCSFVKIIFTILAWCVCVIHMWVVYTQHMYVCKCTACACAYRGQRIYVGCGPLSISLGHLPWATFLPVSASYPASWGSYANLKVDISKGLGKNSVCVLLTQVTVLASGVTGLNLQLSLSLDRMFSRQPSSFFHSLTKKKEKTAMTSERRCGWINTSNPIVLLRTLSFGLYNNFLWCRVISSLQTETCGLSLKIHTAPKWEWKAKWKSKWFYHSAPCIVPLKIRHYPTLPPFRAIVAAFRWEALKNVST